MAKKFNYDVCIVGGLGHVGLPLGILFASKGLNVSLYDINNKFSKLVQQGTMPFMERKAQPLLKKIIKNKKLNISLDNKTIKESKYIIISIGTLIDKKKEPATKLFITTIKKLSKFLNKSQFLIIRSSVYPGTCSKIYNLLKSKNFSNISYCPERIQQGHSLEELKKFPQIVSGFNKLSIKESSKLFKKISPKIIISSVQEVELMKLFTNAWRYTQFAISNEFFMMCEDKGISYKNVRNIMIDNYDRAKNIPKAGFAAGPCLYKDTLQLSHYFNKNFKIGNSAIHINDNLPNYLVKKLILKYKLKTKTIGILGMAFKANIDDIRNSLSIKLKKLLKNKCNKVLCSDEYIKNKNYISKEELIKLSDIIIIGAPHMQYKRVNFEKKTIINIWENEI